MRLGQVALMGQDLAECNLRFMVHDRKVCTPALESLCVKLYGETSLSTEGLVDWVKRKFEKVKEKIAAAFDRVKSIFSSSESKLDEVDKAVKSKSFNRNKKADRFTTADVNLLVAAIPLAFASLTTYGMWVQERITLGRKVLQRAYNLQKQQHPDVTEGSIRAACKKVKVEYFDKLAEMESGMDAIMAGKAAAVPFSKARAALKSCEKMTGNLFKLIKNDFSKNLGDAENEHIRHLTTTNLIALGTFAVTFGLLVAVLFRPIRKLFRRILRALTKKKQ